MPPITPLQTTEWGELVHQQVWTNISAESVLFKLARIVIALTAMSPIAAEKLRLVEKTAPNTYRSVLIYLCFISIQNPFLSSTQEAPFLEN